MIYRTFFTLLCFLLAQISFANIGGSDLQNFNPTTNGIGFITVHPSETLSSGQLNFGTFLNYTTNSLAYSTLSTAPNNQTFSEPNDQLLYSNLHFGVGLMKGWDFGLSAGFINSQNIENSNFLFAYGDTGVNDVRLNTKVRLHQGDEFRVAALITIDFDQIKNNPFVGDNPGPAVNFEGAADFLITPDLLWAINIGYRLRQKGTAIPNTGVTPLSDQWIYSTAISYKTDDNGSALISEIYGSSPLEQTPTPTDRDLSNLEVLLGYRWNGFKSVALHGGLGTEIYEGLGSPDIRIYAGLNFNFGFLDKNSSKEDTARTPRVRRDNNRNDIISEENNKLSLQEKDSDEDGVNDKSDSCQDTRPGAIVNAYGCEIDGY